jgi:thiamine-phosphate pyrophosphorylase
MSPFAEGARPRDPRLAGLYAITDAELCAKHGGVVAAAERVLSAGVTLLQYRDKTDEHARRGREAVALAALCERHGALLIVNDDLELARLSGAAGVHLGADDADPAAARSWLGADALIGVSCYADLGRARRATLAGADYLAFGSVQPSRSKPAAPPAPLALFGEARAFELPLCAIGGIEPAHAAALRAAGADMLAVISGLFGAKDPAKAARAYLKELTAAGPPPGRAR